MAGPVSELIIDAVASTVLPDIATVAVRANMVDDALCIGSLAVSVTFIVSPDFASVAFELLEDMSKFCFAGDVCNNNTMRANSYPMQPQLYVLQTSLFLQIQ